MRLFSQNQSLFSLRGGNSHYELKMGLLSQAPEVQSGRVSFRAHAIFALLHIVVAMLWVSTFWAFGSLSYKAQEVLRPLEFRKNSNFLDKNPSNDADIL
jgi:hypothetical protein